MPVPWTKDEEIKLLKEIADKKSISELAKIHDRSENAIELRLKKLIYDNIVGGKSKSSLAKLLNIEPDKIKQYYYEYKGFIEKKGMTVDKEKLSDIEHKLDKDISREKSKKSEKSDKSNKSKKEEKIKDRLRKLEKENKVMKEILDNIGMKKKIDKLIDHGFLNSKIKSIIKKIK